MCIQVPCIYLLSPPSAVIWNMYNTSRDQWRHLQEDEKLSSGSYTEMRTLPQKAMEKRVLPFRKMLRWQDNIRKLWRWEHSFRKLWRWKDTFRKLPWWEHSFRKPWDEKTPSGSCFGNENTLRKLWRREHSLRKLGDENSHSMSYRGEVILLQ